MSFLTAQCRGNKAPGRQSVGAGGQALELYLFVNSKAEFFFRRLCDFAVPVFLTAKAQSTAKGETRKK
jgi:hypothetical protein